MYACGTLWVCMNVCMYVCMYNIMCCFQLLHISYNCIVLYCIYTFIQHFLLLCLSGLYRIRVLGLGLLHPGNKGLGYSVYRAFTVSVYWVLGCYILVINGPKVKVLKM